MSSDKKVNVHSSACGVVWLVGWLFSIGFLDMGFWQAVLGIILWPYYIGNYLYQLHQVI
jgi:uncharacterized membrane protein